MSEYTYAFDAFLDAVEGDLRVQVVAGRVDCVRADRDDVELFGVKHLFPIGVRLHARMAFLEALAPAGVPAATCATCNMVDQQVTSSADGTGRPWAIELGHDAGAHRRRA